MRKMIVGCLLLVLILPIRLLPGESAAEQEAAALISRSTILEFDPTQERTDEQRGESNLYYLLRLLLPTGHAETVPVQSVTLSDSAMAITKAFTLTATVLPENATDKTLTWSSSNLGVAIVDTDGIVTPVKEGECFITATANDGSGKTASCTISVESFTYTVNGYEATITGYIGADKSLDIPGEIDGISVATIGERAFSERTDLTGSLTIGNGITSIGVEAFIGCSGLTGSLVIPDSVTHLGDAAFDLCSGFSGSLVIPDSVTSIGSITFALCSGFTGSLTIGNSVSNIGDRAFIGCIGLNGDLVIPNSVTNIASEAFYDCSGFTGSLTIGDNVRSIGSDAFTGCSGFTGDLVIPDSVTNIGSGAFYNCSGFNGRLVISNSLNSIGENAFRFCSGLTGDLVIPDSVTSVGAGAFDSCSGFTGSLILPQSIKTIGEYAFYYCTAFSSAYILSESYVMSGTAFMYSAPIFYGYEGTPIQSFSLSNDLTFIPFGITIAGVSSLPVFDNTQLNASTVLFPGELETLNWRSSDETIATVNQTGLVTGVAPGTTVITAASDNFTADFTIEVIKAVYDMSKARWDYSTAIPFDGIEKTVLVTGLPAGVTAASYTGNTATDIGSYTASVTLAYDALNYEEPLIVPLAWEIADTTLPGDANGDGTIDIMDLVSIIDYIVSDTEPGSSANADANGDGTVDIMDLVWIIDQIVGNN